MYAITHNWVDWAFAIAVLVAIVVFVGVQFFMDWYRTHNTRSLMNHAMEDYSFSSRLVREMDRQH